MVYEDMWRMCLENVVASKIYFEREKKEKKKHWSDFWFSYFLYLNFTLGEKCGKIFKVFSYESDAKFLE